VTDYQSSLWVALHHQLASSTRFRALPLSADLLVSQTDLPAPSGDNSGIRHFSFRLSASVCCNTASRHPFSSPLAASTCLFGHFRDSHCQHTSEIQTNRVIRVNRNRDRARELETETANESRATREARFHPSAPIYNSQHPFPTVFNCYQPF
jgi:hypothetical protein